MNKKILEVSPSQIMTNPYCILDWVRPEVNSSYLHEAFDVLRIGRTRPAIGSIWNCVIDDLRNKVLLVGPEIFSGELNINPPIKVYEDFQDRVLDIGLIEGCYKLGILDREGYEMMKQALNQRHIFDGHPRSTQPDQIKTLSFINDCIKYVLAVPAPLPAINVEDYMETIRGANYSRDKEAALHAFNSMSVVYQNQLLNMMFDEYVKLETDIDVQGNIEFAAPIFWKKA